MQKKILWVVAALALIAIPAVVGLVALRGDDGNSSAARRAAALVQTPGQAAGVELTIDGMKELQGKAIDVMSFSWGVSNAGSSRTGTAGTAASKAELSELQITKAADESSPALFLATATGGKPYAKAVLSMRRAGGKATQEYLQITLEQVLISSYQMSGSGGGSDLPTEQISLNFTKITHKVTPAKPDGTPGTPSEAVWDLKLAK